MGLFGIAKKGFGKAVKKIAGKKSNWIKDEAGTITDVKAGSGKVPWYIGAGKDLKDRSRIVKTWKRGQTIDAVNKAEKQIKEGTATLKKLRTTGWTKKPHGRRGRKQYFPKESGKMAHTIKKK